MNFLDSPGIRWMLASMAGELKVGRWVLFGKISCQFTIKCILYSLFTYNGLYIQLQYMNYNLLYKLLFKITESVNLKNNDIYAYLMSHNRNPGVFQI